MKFGEKTKFIKTIGSVVQNIFHQSMSKHQPMSIQVQITDLDWQIN